MKQATRDRLNALNLRFYAAHARAFSDTRSRPWGGFGRVLEHLREPVPSVLDVGCGNGRLLNALSARFGTRYAYLGVDASEALLGIARACHPHEPGRVRFLRADFVADPPERALPQAQFACVCLFGVLHHVPGSDARTRLLAAASARVAPGGVLAFTTWRFDRDPRTARRRLSAHELVAPDDVHLTPSELDPGDALLRFGEGGDAVRYCHLIDDAERARLLAGLGLDRVAQFSADGTSGDLNDYVVLRAPLAPREP